MNFRLETALGVSSVCFMSAFSAISGLPPRTCEQAICGWSKAGETNAMSRGRSLNLFPIHNLGLTLYTSSKRFWGFFDRAPGLEPGGTPGQAYLAPPPPVSAGSSTVTDQSTLRDSITR